MNLVLSISPHGHLHVETAADEEGAVAGEAVATRIERAFVESAAQGLLHLATAELETNLPAAFSFARDWGRAYLTQLCHRPEIGSEERSWSVPVPPVEERTAMALTAPPMRGAEYLNAEVLEVWWLELDRLVQAEVEACGNNVQQFLEKRNPLWRRVGRVTFHLAENKRDPEFPFAFLATYSSRLSAHGKPQHLPLERALREYGAAKNHAALLSLLQPIQQAAERLPWVKELTESGEMYQPLAWGPRDAYRFLQDVPNLEASGLMVRVPDWWKAAKPPRPVVNVKIGGSTQAKLGVDALLDFSVNVTLDGEALNERELQAILASSGGLISLKGKWVELDSKKLAEALDHWKKIERETEDGGISFFEGMRLLAGANLQGDAAITVPEADREWVGISAGVGLDAILGELRQPRDREGNTPSDLKATLRPYQQTGVHWLRFVTRLGLGACLADDMGLGKTIQVIALLLHLKAEQASHISPQKARADMGHPHLETEQTLQTTTARQDTSDRETAQRGDHPGLKSETWGTRIPSPSSSLLVVPASLIANWKAELSRFAPSLSFYIAHPSEPGIDLQDSAAVSGRDLVITTYTMLCRLDWLRQREWKLAILDEAQAIKNSGIRQTRAAKELRAEGRIALTGTPIENRLSDLWSLFDFLNPGLLGNAKAFAGFVKQREAGQKSSYGPLRALVRPYILRRLKTDRKVIADLPEKTEVRAFCGLTKYQIALYEQAVRELKRKIAEADGIQRRGIVLASLMRLKQICNHPSQGAGDGGAEGEYAPERSGKFQRLAEICRELAERQEKALVFTQFREITAPLENFLRDIFGRSGLVLHGQTPVGKRQAMVEAFQREDGPPFFVLSLKAGGTGLNLTSASHVIHFDRWWNPAVENQATDRAFRIGQKRNVMVHKFVCRGTVEEKIDAIIAAKTGLSEEMLDDRGGEALLTELDNDQLLRLVALDLHQAMEA
ncbi:MAG: DEAD/DEAH box helicase [Acidobacteriaceae bacterium]